MQNHNRDTQKFAIKCSSITVDDNYADDMTPADTDKPKLRDIDVYKDPITDPGKASKRGKVTTWYDTETREYITGIVGEQPNTHCVEALVLVFKNGLLYKDYTLEDIRNRSH